MAGSPGPRALRRQLGSALRQYRLGAGLTVKEVAGQLLCSEAKISRIETAQRGISLRDVRDLCELYRVTPDSQEQLMRLAQQSREAAWWQNFDLDPALEKYVGLEGSAVEIKDYQLGAVPGLLQTREYATEVINTWIKNDPVALKNAVDVRMMRQEYLADHTKLHVVIDESVVRRVIGTRDIMRDQIVNLITQSSSSRVSLRLIPFDAGASKGMISGFVLLHFAQPAAQEGLPAMSDVLYLEGVGDGIYLDKTENVQEYVDVFGELQARALSERQTITFLSAVVREM
jgi:transcriptional regulator with XRE-family HTH domain